MISNPELALTILMIAGIVCIVGVVVCVVKLGVLFYKEIRGNL